MGLFVLVSSHLIMCCARLLDACLQALAKKRAKLTLDVGGKLVSQVDEICGGGGQSDDNV